VSLDDVELFLVDSLEEANNLFTYLADQPEISIDTETTGFKWHGQDYARTVQVGDENKAWMIPIDRWWGLFLDLMNRRRTEKMNFMNAKFDYPFLRKAGIELDKSRIHDVGVMSHILEPHMSRALKNQASRWIDPRAGAAQTELSEALSSRSDWTWATIPIEFEPYWTYGALDAVLTQRLANHHRPLVMAQAPDAYEIENAYQWVALRAETNGVQIDVPYAEEYHTKFLSYCHYVEKWCKTEYNISPGSNQKVIAILQEQGYDFDKTTKSGALSLDGDVLEDIDHPLAQAVLKRRRLQKLASTYLQFYMGHTDANSRIHPTINTLGARTSRQSMNDPNFQNLPRVSETNPAANVVRNCVVARPGNVLIFCDFDQIEMRGLAIMSEDEGLRAAFRSENDFFLNLAQEVFQDPTITNKKDPRRQIVKNTGYAKIYGAGVAKLALTAGIPYEMAQHANSMFDGAYPRVKGFLGRLYNEAMAMRDGPSDLAYTVCPLTGRRHYADPGKEYALANYKIQGWAASLFKLKMLELDAAGLGDYITLFVHDEVILDVPQEDARDAVYTLRKIMNDDQMFPVPISAGISWGERWGSKKEWTDELD
jgi:DNA polymerase-1